MTTIGFERNMCSRYVSAAARVKAMQSEEYEKPIFGDVCHPPLIFLVKYLPRLRPCALRESSWFSFCLFHDFEILLAGVATDAYLIIYAVGPENCNGVYFNFHHYRVSPSILITYTYLYLFNKCKKKRWINLELIFISINVLSNWL